MAIVPLAEAAAQDRWQTLPQPPIPPRFEATMHAIGTDLVVFGGQDLAAVHMETRSDGAVLDLQTRAWTKLPDAPLGERTDTIVAKVAGGLLVAGGRDRLGKLRTDAFVLDAHQRKWRPMPAWPVAPRQQCSIATDGDLVATFGGCTSIDLGDGRQHRDWFANGVLVNTRSGTIEEIPRGPLSPRAGAVLRLGHGKLLVAGGYTTNDDGVATSCTDAAAFDLGSGAWTRLDTPALRPQNSLSLDGHGDTVFAVGNDGRHAFGFVWDRATGTCAALQGIGSLDLGMECTRVFGGTERSLLFNAGMQVHDDAWQAFWIRREGLDAVLLPADVHARQAFALAHAGDDVVLFGGNHDIAVAVADGPAPPPRRATGPEGDGLHVDLRTGAATRIPQGPLAPRAHAIAAIANDHLLVLWGDAPARRSSRELCADGATYRLR